MKTKYLIIGSLFIYFMLNVSGIIMYSNDPAGNVTYVRADVLFNNDSDSVRLNNSFLILDLISGNLTNTTCIIFADGSSICDDSDIDTDTIQNITGSKYIITIASILDLNETVLNDSIADVLAGSTFVDTDTFLKWNDTAKYTSNDTGLIDIDETVLNASISALAGGTDTVWNITDSKFLDNDSGILIVNETVLNTSIEAITDQITIPSDITDLTWVNDWKIAYSNNTGLQELPFNDDDGKFLMSNGESALSWETPAGSSLSFSDSALVNDSGDIGTNTSINAGNLRVRGELDVYSSDSNDYLVISVVADVPRIRAIGAPLSLMSIGDSNDYLQLDGDGTRPWLECVGCETFYFRDKTDSNLWDGIDADFFTEHTENISKEYNKQHFNKIIRDLKAVSNGEHPISLAPNNRKEAIRKQEPLTDDEYEDIGTNIGSMGRLNALAIDYLIDELCAKDNNYGFCIEPKVKEFKPERNKTNKNEDE